MDTKWIITTIIGIIVVLASLGTFNSANIIPIVEGSWDKNPCPDSFYGKFDMGFSNVGKRDTNICVQVNSNNLNFTYNSTCFYTKSTGQQYFTFYTSLPEGDYKIDKNYTINISLKYNKFGKFFEKTSNLSCIYMKEDYSGELKLI